MQKIFSVCLLFTVMNVSFAQSKTVKPAAKPYKPPKIFTQLGEYRDSVQLSTKEAIRIIALPLKIYDNVKGTYSISSYQFVYKKKNIVEDEKGKIYISPTMTAQSFKTTPISPIWLTSVKEQLHAGELLWFTDIIVKDVQGRVMYAPDLKIMIQ